MIYSTGIIARYRRVGLDVQAQANFEYIQLDAGAVLNPNGDHPHIVAHVSFFFFHLTIVLTLCVHGKEHA